MEDERDWWLWYWYILPVSLFQVDWIWFEMHHQLDWGSEKETMTDHHHHEILRERLPWAHRPSSLPVVTHAVVMRPSPREGTTASVVRGAVRVITARAREVEMAYCVASWCRRWTRAPALRTEGRRYVAEVFAARARYWHSLCRQKCRPRRWKCHRQERVTTQQQTCPWAPHGAARYAHAACQQARLPRGMLGEQAQEYVRRSINISA